MMRDLLKDKRRIFSVGLSVFISVFLVALFVYGATTISSDISTGNASTTDYIAIGSDDQTDNDVLYFDARNENLTWNDSLTTFTLSDDLQVTGSVSSTEYIAIGSNAQNDDDILYFDARNESFTWSDSVGSFVLSDDFSVATSTATTSAQIFVGNATGTATSTIIIGDNGLKGCLELWDNGIPIRTYANGANLITEVGRCSNH